MSSSTPAPPSPQGEAPALTAPTSGCVAPQFFQLSLTVECARLNGTFSLIKPNPYVEIIVDGKPPKKTDTSKSTYQPHWSETVTLLVSFYYYYSGHFLYFKVYRVSSYLSYCPPSCPNSHLVILMVCGTFQQIKPIT